MARDTEPVHSLPQRAGQGQINQKGDCAFTPSGITCHFHTGQEFLAQPTSPQINGVGELHCIVPTNEPTRPVVYGAHIRCKAKSEAAPTAAPGGEAEACKSDMMEVFSRCSTWRCCDNGTLTNPIATQTPEQRAVHPDFRVCSDEALEIDCSLLENMHGHEANCPIQGGIVAPPVFNPSSH